MNDKPFWMVPYEGLKNFSISIEEWTTQDFIRAIGTWPRIHILLLEPGEQIFLTKLRTFYSCHSQWLEYYLVEMPASRREELRIKLHFTNCINQKTDADFSLAILNLCRQVYGKSELLTSAPSYEHLFFLAEYSMYTQNTTSSGLTTGFPAKNRDGEVLSFNSMIANNHDAIRLYEKALKNNYFEIEEISTDDPDWVEQFLNALIAESVNTAIKNRDRDLNYHCRQFLKAFYHYNAARESGQNAFLWQLINGQLGKSLPGDKPIALPSRKVKGIIGRPRGSLNKKKEIVKKYEIVEPFGSH